MKPTQYDLGTEHPRIQHVHNLQAMQTLLVVLEDKGYHLIKEGEVPPWFHDFAFVGDVTHWSGSHETDSQPLYRIVSDEE